MLDPDTPKPKLQTTVGAARAVAAGDRAECLLGDEWGESTATSIVDEVLKGSVVIEHPTKAENLVLLGLMARVDERDARERRVRACHRIMRSMSIGDNETP
jgi:hypothetical protein